MTPAARVQSAIDLLDLIIAAARGQGASADRIVAEWFKTRRYMGSGDRRAVRELVYGAVRACGKAQGIGCLGLFTSNRQFTGFALEPGDPHVERSAAEQGNRIFSGNSAVR